MMKTGISTVRSLQGYCDDQLVWWGVQKVVEEKARQVFYLKEIRLLSAKKYIGLHQKEYRKARARRQLKCSTDSRQAKVSRTKRRRMKFGFVVCVKWIERRI
jgi:hypothetical protein